MTRAITEGEHTNLQATRQASRLFALVDPGGVIFRARINQSFSSYDGIAQLTFDGVTFGDGGDVKPDMTLLIGSTLQGWDVGIARIRKAISGSTIYIGEVSDIQFSDDDYLTVLASWEPWAKHPKVTSEVLYMDYDEAYAGQHASPAPTPILGLDRVVELTGVSVDVLFDASNSYVIGGGALSYQWADVTLTAAAIADDDTATPTFTYNQAGRHVVSCTVTADSTGATYIGYRIVHVLGTNYNPLLECEIGEIRSDVQSGGCQFEMTVYGDLSAIRPNARVLLFTEEYLALAQDEQSPEADRENALFSGWIVSENISFGTEQSAKFEVTGPNGILDKVNALETIIEDTDYSDNVGGAASDWTEINGMTAPWALWHYFTWRAWRCCSLSRSSPYHRYA